MRGGAHLCAGDDLVPQHVDGVAAVPLSLETDVEWATEEVFVVAASVEGHRKCEVGEHTAGVGGEDGFRRAWFALSASSWSVVGSASEQRASAQSAEPGACGACLHACTGRGWGRRSPGARRVARKCRDAAAHTLDAQVAKSQHVLAVGDRQGSHAALGPVLHSTARRNVRRTGTVRNQRVRI